MNLRKIIWDNRFLSDKQRINWYPAFWLMHIKVLELSPDWHHIRILLPHSWIASNHGGSLFGGFQACLADPIAAMACVKMFPGYAVWTRSLHLNFVHASLSDLELRFSVTPEQEEKISQDLNDKGRSTPQFEYGYYLAAGRLCTEIKASVAIRPAGYRKGKAQRKAHRGL